MVDSPTTEITDDEVDQAFMAGFETIDEGLTFDDGFGDYLTSRGYRHEQGSPCTCSDQGRHGHLPECRWTRG